MHGLAFFERRAGVPAVAAGSVYYEAGLRGSYDARGELFLQAITTFCLNAECGFPVFQFGLGFCCLGSGPRLYALEFLDRLVVIGQSLLDLFREFILEEDVARGFGLPKLDPFPLAGVLIGLPICFGNKILVVESLGRV